MDDAAAPYRVIESEHGIWRVREWVSLPTALIGMAPSLICESAELIRRLWTYPAGWRALSDAELLELFDLR